MNLFDLSGKNAVVTGGSTGIGKALAEGLAEAGAKVIIANRNTAEGEETAGELRARGLSVESTFVDISDRESIRALFEKVRKEDGKLDVLVNNAGISRTKPILEFTDGDWDAVMDIDLRGTYQACREVFPLMKDNGGRIINLGSITAYKCLNNGNSIYSVGKSAIHQLTKVLAVEWAPYHIRVNAIAPGVCITRINKENYARHPELLKRVCSTIPMARVSKPEEYKGMAVFLASEAASGYMTGQVLYADGGMSLV